MLMEINKSVFIEIKYWNYSRQKYVKQKIKTKLGVYIQSYV